MAEARSVQGFPRVVPHPSSQRLLEREALRQELVASARRRALVAAQRPLRLAVPPGAAPRERWRTPRLWSAIGGALLIAGIAATASVDWRWVDFGSAAAEAMGRAPAMPGPSGASPLVPKPAAPPGAAGSGAPVPTALVQGASPLEVGGPVADPRKETPPVATARRQAAPPRPAGAPSTSSAKPLAAEQGAPALAPEVKLPAPPNAATSPSRQLIQLGGAAPPPSPPSSSSGALPVGEPARTGSGVRVLGVPVEGMVTVEVDGAVRVVRVGQRVPNGRVLVSADAVSGRYVLGEEAP